MECEVFVCERCGEVCSFEERNIIGGIGGREWCDRCLDEHAFLCQSCMLIFSKDETTPSEVNGQDFCDDCYEDLKLNMLSNDIAGAGPEDLVEEPRTQRADQDALDTSVPDLLLRLRVWMTTD